MMFGTRPWLDEFENPLNEEKLKKATRIWGVEEWEQFQREYPEELDPCGVLLDRKGDIETAFGDDEVSLWDFISDDVPMPILDKLPELKRVLQSLSGTQYRILRGHYLEKMTDRQIAQAYGKSRKAISNARERALKRLIDALEKDQNKEIFIGPVTV